MKVLHAVQSYLPVSENWIYPQIMRVAGVEPAVLCGEMRNRELFPLDSAPCLLDPPPWRVGLGIPRFVNSLAFRFGHASVIASAAARRWQPDLLHAHFGMRGWETLPLRRRLNIPMITSFYGVDAWQVPVASQLWRERYVQLFAEGDLFLAEGPAMRERMAAIGCPAERIRVLRLGVDSAQLPFDRKAFGAPLRVVMMARFVEKKGLPDGLRACAEACRHGTELEITIIGDATDEPGARIKAELHEIAAGHQLQGRVTFAGFLAPAEARLVLRKADVFLCPSKHSADGDAEGGSPLALTEAMALGLLCLGTRHCDLPEVIHHRQTGLLAESGDVEGLASLLREAAANPVAAHDMCARGRAHIEEHFSTAGQVLELAKIYRTLLPGAPRA
jgi:colanic acid/amylovoran biosynthesis glycosyltransferase